MKKLKAYEKSVWAWTKALGTLNKPNLTASELATKRECEAGLRTVSMTLAALKPQKAGLVIPARSALPWDLARAMLPELRKQGAAGMSSSVRSDFRRNRII